MALTIDPALRLLDRLVGRWTTEATHPSMPGAVVHGTAVIEWLEGARFLIIRTHMDHPDFPASISIIGNVAHDRVDGAAGDDAPALSMHYYDSRGVARTYDAGIDHREWRLSRIAPGFSQRFSGRIAEDGGTIDGLWQLSVDGEHWDDDLQITYRRAR